MKILLSLLFVFVFANAEYIAKQIKLVGLTQVSKKIALEKINIKPNTPYTLEHINQTIKDFYQFGYFNDIEVDDDNGTLIYKFTEKPFIINIQMSGYKTREDDLNELYTTMHIKKGTMFTKEKIEKAKAILLNQLNKEGYINSVVEVTIKHINPQSVTVKFDVNKGEEIVITKVRYIGANHLTPDILEENTANKEKDPISWWFGQSDGVMKFDQLQYDNYRIRDTYLQHGYLDAKVSSAFSRIDFNTNKASVEFQIKEGIQYKIDKIIINTDKTIIPAEKLKQGLKLKSGKVFNIKNLRKDAEYLRTQIANKGYAYTKINYDIKKDTKNALATIIFKINHGEKVYINDVIISGNTRTLDRVIRRNIYLAPKDLFNLTDFKDSQTALQRSGFFESVKIKQKKVSDNLMDLYVTVKEAPTGNLILGGGYGSYDGWMINASVSDKNIFGSGLNLSFSLDHSNKKDTATLSLRNPSIHDSIYSGSFNIYKKEELVSADDNSTQGDKTTKIKGGSVGVGRSLGRHTRIGITYALEQSDIMYSINNSDNYTYVTSSLTPYINFNNTDNYYVPREGFIIGDSFNYVGIGGDAKYMQNSFYFKYFYSLEELTQHDIIARYKTNIKIMQDNGEIPSGTTYYLGGPRSVRGYESYAFQPDDTDVPFKKSLTNTIELSFPLIPKAKMRWSLFYDYGMIGTDTFTQIKKAGRGVSIDWYSPVGPLQFIFARAVNPDTDDRTSNFEFSLGSSF